MTNPLKLSREQAVKHIAEEIGEIVRVHLEHFTKTCLNCEHFIDEKTCELANAVPPPRVIAFGCEKYQDRIPF